MKLSSRIYLSIALFVFVLSSGFGFWYGKRGVENTRKIYISIALSLASDAFDDGETEQALSHVYMAKAFERERNKPDSLSSEKLTDGLFARPEADLMLGKIFLEKRQPCLAQGYLLDGFTFLNNEKALIELRMYKETEEMLLKIGQNCEKGGGTQ